MALPAVLAQPLLASQDTQLLGRAAPAADRIAAQHAGIASATGSA